MNNRRTIAVLTIIVVVVAGIGVMLVSAQDATSENLIRRGTIQGREAAAMDVSDVAQLAREANVERLALTHLMPVPTDDRVMGQWFVDPIREGYDGEAIGGRDGRTIVIPVNGASAQ